MTDPHVERLVAAARAVAAKWEPGSKGNRMDYVQMVPTALLCELAHAVAYFNQPQTELPLC